MSNMLRRLKVWFKGYEEAPLWLCFCRLVFAVSTLALIVLFLGPAILSGDVMGFWAYRHWALTFVGLPYIVFVVATFIIVVISGVPTFLSERKRMEESKERQGK